MKNFVGTRAAQFLTSRSRQLTSHALRFASIVAALSFSPQHAIAGGYKFTFQAGEQKSIRYNMGRQEVDSVFNSSVVRILEPVHGFKKRSEIFIMVLNRNQAPFNFSPSNVRIRLPDGSVLPMISPDQLAQEEKARRKRRAIAAALSGAASSISASSAGYYSGMASGTAIGPYGTTRVQGVYSGYDPTAAAIAQQDAQRQIQATNDAVAMRNTEGQAVVDAAYKVTTIDTGAVSGGIMTFDVPKSIRPSKLPVDVVLLIDAGQDYHEISAKIEKYD